MMAGCPRYFATKMEERMELVNSYFQEQMKEIREYMQNCPICVKIICAIIMFIWFFVVLVIVLVWSIIVLVLTIAELSFCLIVDFFTWLANFTCKKRVSHPTEYKPATFQTLFHPLSLGFYEEQFKEQFPYITKNAPTNLDYQNYKMVCMYPEFRPSDKLGVQFLGTNSLFITDGTTNILVDPYFSRLPIPYCGPTPKFKCSEIIPVVWLIEKTLKLAKIEKVDAILLTHAHWDHALDIAAIYKYFSRGSNPTPPKIYGDMSVYNICVGGGVPASDIQVISTNAPYIIGSKTNPFIVRFLGGRHSHAPLMGAIIYGHIKEPLKPPALVADYKEGNTHTILIEHENGVILNQGSANFEPDAFWGIADTLKPDVPLYFILGITGFYKNPTLPLWKTDFYKHVVLPFCGENDPRENPKAILFSHWDWFNERIDTKPSFYDKQCKKADLRPWDFFRKQNEKFIAGYKDRHSINVKYLPIGYYFIIDKNGP